MRFERNSGQTDELVRFLSRGLGYTLFLTLSEAVLLLDNTEASTVGGAVVPESSLSASLAPKHSQNTSVIRMGLVGAHATPGITGMEILPGESHYFVGNDRNQWRTGVSSYARVRYQSVYPDIDWVFYGNQKQRAALAVHQALYLVGMCIDLLRPSKGNQHVL